MEILIRMNPSSSVSLQTVMFPDLALLTIKGVEYDAVLSILNERKIPTSRVDGVQLGLVITFTLGQESNRPIRVIVVAGADEQGPVKSGVFTSSVLHMFRPASILMLGMCAGVDKSMGLGDVIIIINAFPLDEGLLDANEKFHSDGRRVSADPHATALANYAISNAPDLLRVQEGHSPRIYTGDGVTGSVVREDGQIPTDLSRKIRAYEMEASGFMTAVDMYNSLCDDGLKSLCLGVYKGVADMANAEDRANALMKRERQAKATKNACMVALRAIELQGLNLLSKHETSSIAARAYTKSAAVLNKWNLTKSLHQQNTIAELTFKPANDACARVGVCGQEYVVLRPRPADPKRYTLASICDILQKNEVPVPQVILDLIAKNDSERREDGFVLEFRNRAPTLTGFRKKMDSSSTKKETKERSKADENQSTKKLKSSGADQGEE